MVMFHVLYQDEQVLIIQTHAGEFDKWGDDLYGMFNMGLHVADEPNHVLNNRLNLLKQLNEMTGGKVHQLSWLNQTHSATVVHADVAMTCQDADALISDECGVGLSIMTADCVPIALFGQSKQGHQQIACVHAGWQGLTKGIIANTCHQFRHGSVKAVVGACISQANYEMDNALAGQIIKSVTDKRLVQLSFDELYRAIVLKKEDSEQVEKCFFDVVKLTKLQLAHLSVALMNEDVPCSYDTPNFYSYRQQTHAHKPHTGRMATVIVQLST